jgi:predicted enzyme related to lactoylglutathione lyase
VGTFVWHEQVSPTTEKAKQFYTELFGWGTEVFKPGEIDYSMIYSGGRTHHGFSKALEGALPRTGSATCASTTSKRPSSR